MSTQFMYNTILYFLLPIFGAQSHHKYSSGIGEFFISGQKSIKTSIFSYICVSRILVQSHFFTGAENNKTSVAIFQKQAFQDLCLYKLFCLF